MSASNTEPKNHNMVDSTRLYHDVCSLGQNKILHFGNMMSRLFEKICCQCKSKSALIDDRKVLEEQEFALLDCLLGGTAQPSEIEEKQLEACASSLLNKRCRAAGACLPHIKADLGDEFEREFALFAVQRPSVHAAGPGADARDFLRYLQRRKKVSAPSWKCMLKDWLCRFQRRFY